MEPVRDPTSSRFAASSDRLGSPLAQAAIGKDLGPVDNAIEYSIVVGDLAGDVTNADLMGVFHNPDPGYVTIPSPGSSPPFIHAAMQRSWLTRWNEGDEEGRGRGEKGEVDPVSACMEANNRGEG